MTVRPTETHAPGLAGHRALAHPLRLRILRVLRAEPMSASGLARRLDVLPGTARFHLGVLERAGIVSRSSERMVRGGREVLYAAPQVVRLDDDVAPSVRAATDRAYVRELTGLLEQAATEPGGVAGFSLHVSRLRPEDAEVAERILIETSQRLAALDSPDDQDARPHLVATQFVRLPAGTHTP